MISIVIPTLNEETVIANTILALKNTLKIPHEIIVSDGKSIDKTVEIARKYADKVEAYSGEARQTIAGGRNAGARVASGQFLVFLDADCSLKDPESFFARALSVFENNKDLVAITARLKVLAEDETSADKIFFGFLNNFFQLSNNVFHVGDAAGEFQMMRREAYDLVGGYREDMVAHEDGVMFKSLSRIGRTRLEPTLTVYHTGRRAHKIGWPRVLFFWFINTVYANILDKSFFKEWKPIR